MVKSAYAVYGAGGCGRGAVPVAKWMLQAQGLLDSSELVLIDDRQAGSQVNGYSVLGLDEFASLPATEKFVNIAIADGATRRDLAEQCLARGLGFFEVRAPNSVTFDSVEVGEGAMLLPYVTLTSNIRIGCHFHANLYSYVEHDCVIGDYVTFAPGVKCNGNVVIEDYAYLGAGCVIKQGSHGQPLRIGEGAVVGMGAVVTKDVAPGAVVVGNPARTQSG